MWGRLVDANDGCAPNETNRVAARTGKGGCAIAPSGSIFSAMAVGLLCVAASTQSAGALAEPLPPGVAACAFNAMTKFDDPDPAGPNIRSAPNVTAAILGRLPPAWSAERDMGKISPEFRVIGTRDGWFLIEGAHYDPGYFVVKSAPKLFAGRGWVAGNLITTGLRAPTLKRAPNDDAADVVAFISEAGGGGVGPDSIVIGKILDCRGPWFYVEVPLSTANYRLSPLLPSGGPKGTVRGWTKGSCTAQLTTCV